MDPTDVDRSQDPDRIAHLTPLSGLGDEMHFGLKMGMGVTEGNRNVIEIELL